MRRVVVVGASGSGKTTLARALAARLAVPCVELDALHHLPEWEEAPDDHFLALVRDATAGDGWVVDGSYRSLLADELWPRADTVVLLDLPRWRVMLQVVGRTLRRLLTREELWHGNREQWSRVLSTDPERSIVLWAWRTHPGRAERVVAALEDPALAAVRLVRLRSRREVSRFLAAVAPPPSVMDETDRQAPP